MKFNTSGADKPLREPADLVLLHQGIVPNLNLALSLRCEHAWDDAQRAFRPRVDAWGNTSVAGMQIAGDNGASSARRRRSLAASSPRWRRREFSADFRQPTATASRSRCARN